MVMQMKIVGLIAEYNPFHNGHIYHIEQIKKLYPNSLLILVLNGYFLERGEISVLAKETKTKLALKYGVDIVLELPVIYGTQSADYFAKGCLEILNKFAVDTLVFGSETNDVNFLTKIAKENLKGKKLVKSAESYPRRLQNSLGVTEQFFPNDLLGISYIKEISQNNYQIIPVTIKRTSAYHDTTACTGIISASNIRQKKENQLDISPYLPLEAQMKWQDIDMNLYFQILKSKILTDLDLTRYIDVTEGIENKLKKEVIDSQTMPEFLEKIKSKRYTYNRLRRMLTHIFLGLTKEKNTLPISYIRILGFSKKGQDYLKKEKDYFQKITHIDKESEQYKLEITASLLYDLLTKQISSSFDRQNKPIIYPMGVNEESQK